MAPADSFHYFPNSTNRVLLVGLGFVRVRALIAFVTHSLGGLVAPRFAVTLVRDALEDVVIFIGGGCDRSCGNDPQIHAGLPPTILFLRYNKSHFRIRRMNRADMDVRLASRLLMKYLKDQPLRIRHALIRLAITKSTIPQAAWIANAAATFGQAA